MKQYIILWEVLEITSADIIFHRLIHFFFSESIPAFRTHSWETHLYMNHLLCKQFAQNNNTYV